MLNVAKIISTKIKFFDRQHPHVKYLTFECLYCHKYFEKQASYYRKQSKRCRNACSFCSMNCKSKNIASRKFLKGEKHPKWKGGRNINSNGYVLLFNPTHPHSLANKYVGEHRLVMEKKLGRFLEHDEFVHHINRDKTDNRIENLQIMSNSEHAFLHKALDIKTKSIKKPQISINK